MVLEDEEIRIVSLPMGRLIQAPVRTADRGWNAVKSGR